MSGDPMVILAVAGGAPVSYENISDLLHDYLLIDTDDEKEFAFYLPADKDLTTEAVIHTASWLEEMDAGFMAVSIGAPGRKGKAILSAAEDEIGDEVGDDDDDCAAVLIKVLADQLEAGYDVSLLLSWGNNDDAPDELTNRLLELAVEAGIPVKDLTSGLDDLSFKDESESAEDDEPAPEPAKPARRGSRAKKDAPVKELKEEEVELADEAQADLPTQPDAAVPDLVTTLAFVAQKLDFEDRANAANQMQPAYSRPLTRAVRHHLDLLLQQHVGATPESDSEAVSEPVEKKPARRRGKPRDTASDVVSVYVNEDAKTVRLNPGRGRPKKGEEKREMPRSEYQEMVDSGDYTPF